LIEIIGNNLEKLEIFAPIIAYGLILAIIEQKSVASVSIILFYFTNAVDAMFYVVCFAPPARRNITLRRLVGAAS
jgi:hypothetical protein